MAVDVCDNLYTELDQRFNQFRQHVLIASHHFHQDWPGWEMQPAGNERGLLLSGACEFILRVDNQEKLLTMQHVGSYVVVSEGVWHTARIATQASLLFITPGENTLNAGQPESTAD